MATKVCLRETVWPPGGVVCAQSPPPPPNSLCFNSTLLGFNRGLLSEWHQPVPGQCGVVLIGLSLCRRSKDGVGVAVWLQGIAGNP